MSVHSTFIETDAENILAPFRASTLGSRSRPQPQSARYSADDRASSARLAPRRKNCKRHRARQSHGSRGHRPEDCGQNPDVRFGSRDNESVRCPLLKMREQLRLRERRISGLTIAAGGHKLASGGSNSSRAGSSIHGSHRATLWNSAATSPACLRLVWA
jgi:hypothetical protein